MTTLAPSIHNTQPWRFRLGAGHVDLYADTARALPVLDPTGRQLHVSCGAALEHGALAIRGTGHAVDTALLPDPAQPDWLARLTVGAVAPATAAEQALVHAMVTRHTYRGAFDPRPVPPQLVALLAEDAAALGAWLHALQRPADVIRLGALLQHADAAEVADPAYQAELWRWRREGAPDGVPAAALPRTQPLSNLALRDFGTGGGAAEPRPVDHPLIAVLGTNADDRVDWLTAGQALARVLLRAAANGVQASPLTQVIDLPWYRSRLRVELGLVSEPQFVLRMGYPAEPTAPATPRQALDNVLD